MSGRSGSHGSRLWIITNSAVRSPRISSRPIARHEPPCRLAVFFVTDASASPPPGCAPGIGRGLGRVKRYPLLLIHSKESIRSRGRVAGGGYIPPTRVRDSPQDPGTVASRKRGAGRTAHPAPARFNVQLTTKECASRPATAVCPGCRPPRYPHSLDPQENGIECASCQGGAPARDLHVSHPKGLDAEGRWFLTGLRNN